MPGPSAKRMTLVEALQALRALRRDEVVVTSMGNAREWQKLGLRPLEHGAGHVRCAGDRTRPARA
jgi:hypothetical protein